MNKITTVMVTLGTGLILAASASAGTIMQTIPVGATDTNVADATTDGHFNGFGFYLANSTVAAGQILTGVTISFSGTENITSFTLVNSTGALQSYAVTLAALYGINSGLGSTTAISNGDLNNLDSGSLNGNLFAQNPLLTQNTIVNGATQTYFTGGVDPCTGHEYSQTNPTLGCTNPVSTTGTGMFTASATTTSATPGYYNGTGCAISNTATCEFDLSWDAILNITSTNATLTGAGSQTGQAAGTYTITYTYGPAGTPEPTTMVLFGSGLVGLGLLRKRSASKS